MAKHKKIDWNSLNTGFYWAKLYGQSGYNYIIEFTGVKPFCRLLGWKTGTQTVSILDPFDVVSMIPIPESVDVKEVSSNKN